VTGGSYAFLTPRELARLGQLLLDQGRWADEQLVPSAWVELMTEVRSDFGCHGVNAATATSLVQQGAGIGIITSQVAGHDVWAAGGYGGQAILVVPDLDVVVVITQEVGPVFCSETHAVARVRPVAARSHDRASAAADPRFR
jgi:CubicO group peptidase (beta-lactamase class C family)